MSSHHRIAKIVSGGQTGADRGALDAAIERGVRHGGWCPKGRRAEDGNIPDKYELVEASSANYLVRTEMNVIDSHCTVIFTFGKPTGGSTKTISFADEHRRPCLSVDLAAMTDEQAANEVLSWLSPGGLVSPDVAVPQTNPVVNIAGSRESKAPGIQNRVKQVLLAVLNPQTYQQGPE